MTIQISQSSNWFDENGLMNPYGENGILFTTEYLALKSRTKIDVGAEIKARDAINFILTKNRKDIRWTDGDGTWSHDNHTALVCASKILNMKLHKKFFYYQWWRRAHPRDFIFYMWASGGLLGLIGFSLLWIHTIIVVITCLSTKKAKNGALDTDGKLLAWLRTRSFNMPITKFLIDKAIQKNRAAGSWKKVFQIYFGDPNHPNRNFPDYIYNS